MGALDELHDALRHIGFDEHRFGRSSRRVIQQLPDLLPLPFVSGGALSRRHDLTRQMRRRFQDMQEREISDELVTQITTQTQQRPIELSRPIRTMAGVYTRGHNRMRDARRRPNQQQRHGQLPEQNPVRLH